MRARKVSNSKSDFQCSLRLPVMVPSIDTYGFLLVFHCNYVSILYHFRDIIAYLNLIKFKEIT